jgi:hypothetical protein
MKTHDLEHCFDSYLSRFHESGDIAPFLRVYTRLLLAFKDEIPLKERSVLLEREKQLRGLEFNPDGFAELSDSSRNGIYQGIGSNASASREAQLNRMLYCAMLDLGESDFFYMTEPVFEFARVMGVSPDVLGRILESEFVGFSAP